MGADRIDPPPQQVDRSHGAGDRREQRPDVARQDAK
jgi:hypothetical protein